MTYTSQNQRTLIRVLEPEFIRQEDQDNWKVVYKPQDVFKIEESYTLDYNINTAIIQLNLNRNNFNPQTPIKPDNYRYLFSKFKDYEVSNVKFEYEINNRELPNPIIEEFERNPFLFNPLSGTGDITFHFMKNTNDNRNAIPTNITLYNIPLKGLVKKRSGIHYWKLELDNKILYYQLYLLLSSRQNIEETFMEFNNFQNEQFNDLEYYFNMIQEDITGKIVSYITS